MSTPQSYDKDFYGWLTDNVALMRRGQLDRIDVENIAEELEAMAKSEKRELLSRLAVLLMHLLKWHYQAPKGSRSWRTTILAQRMDVSELLEDSPGLRPFLIDKLQAVYEKAKLKAEDETGIDRRQFPDHCPYALEDILAADFFPGDESAD
ncbi:DUF29 domain-containing protein [Thiocapsa sp.]|uniref:DUF29 domain-containing protein n=1 Tax=Thiocapsa sp. TaxID=2024551 RepID=UPI002C620760|nr:DUF29 domain-containing protein [Thiocapsa sp.]HSO84894.1 DUF29 domain-containing protein [Thiocapsa sp.]